MDPRITDHARILVDWSARVEPSDNVIVVVSPGAIDLATAVAAELGDRGANPLSILADDEITRAFLRSSDGRFDPDPSHELEMYRNADVVLGLRGDYNTHTFADVPGDRRRPYDRSRREITVARMATDWVTTVHPTRSLAQQAGMSYPEYCDFVYDAILFDWETLADEMEHLRVRLDEGSTVRIDAPGIDIEFSISDRLAVNSAASVVYDSHNLPSGEVFTAPATADGRIRFDVPMTIAGRQLRDVTLEFVDGVVVEFDAARNADTIADLLETDAGARRIGELGFGMNRNIDRVTNNILFDEKMGGTVHLALGRPYNACLPSETAAYESAIHVDFIADIHENAKIWIDDDLIQRNGRFQWESGFSPG